jgi:hypothetical protein
MRKGIDISSHQGDINFDYIKDNYDFVIIRCGYGSDLSADDSECSQCDTMAQTYINECEARNIPYALYLYQYAADNEQSRSEAAHVREWYNKSNPIGVFLDIEDADGYKERHGIDYYSTQALAITWLDELADIKAKGIYASHSWLNTYMNVDELIEHGALIWEAHWNDDGEICDDKFAMSQESSDHHLDDGTRVDYDIMRDEVYNQLVGVSDISNEDESIESDDQTSQELDEDVIDAIYRGEYGNGDERREKLEAAGYNYADYQAAMEAKYYSSKDDTPAGNEEEPAEGTPQEKEESVAVVELGGSFCQIARDYLGDEGRAQELAEYNNMTLDDMLYAGMELRLPN